MLRHQQWFEDSNLYYLNTPSPPQLSYPKLGTVRVFGSGKTQPGWGATEFMESWEAGHFDPSRTARHYERYSQPFAYIMRTLPMICVDIDGKNGGVPTARTLALPATFGERSKSGNGYHLFYSIPYTPWHESLGFNEFPDIIGLVPGVDIKGTGLVFHYPNQRWNGLDVAQLPPTLVDLIGRARDVRFQTRVTKQGVEALDDEDLMILHDTLLTELNTAKIPVGERNNTLYKLGSRLCAAGAKGWEFDVRRRGAELGLDEGELDELVKNIHAYG
jgi:hypothetical protein